MTTYASIYIGKPEALQAEIGLNPCYKGKYVVAAFTAAGEEYTPECVDTKADAKAIASDYAVFLEGRGETVQIAWVA